MNAASAGPYVVRSPFVGVFLRRLSPDSAPLVEPGSVVAEGQSVCVVEAMKLLNEVEAEQPGVVEQILVEDGAQVEFGQALIEVRAS